MVDTVGTDVASTNSERGTVFHAYCATGVWPAEINRLPPADIEEIKRWHKPNAFPYRVGDVTHTLSYANAIKELRVALDWSFEPVDVDPELPQDEIAAKHPEVMVCGHLDMVWLIPERDLIIICDIKSTIFAVKDRTESLQLHGYGMAAAAKLGVSRYVTAIWDAQNGEYLVRPDGAVELDGFEAEDIRARIKLAATDRPGGYVTGGHCSGCWKRFRCKAHLVESAEGDFAPLLNGTATEKDVRLAIVKSRQLKDLKDKVDQACQDWIRQRGPVRSEDGTKEYRVGMRAGRPATDYAAIARDLGVRDLEAYKKRGSDFEAFDWRNVK